jgi:hypothetical protein
MSTDPCSRSTAFASVNCATSASGAAEQQARAVSICFASAANRPDVLFSSASAEAGSFDAPIASSSPRTALMPAAISPAIVIPCWSFAAIISAWKSAALSAAAADAENAVTRMSLQHGRSQAAANVMRS